MPKDTKKLTKEEQKALKKQAKKDAKKKAKEVCKVAKENEKQITFDALEDFKILGKKQNKLVKTLMVDESLTRVETSFKELGVNTLASILNKAKEFIVVLHSEKDLGEGGYLGFAKQVLTEYKSISSNEVKVVKLFVVVGDSKEIVSIVLNINDLVHTEGEPLEDDTVVTDTVVTDTVVTDTVVTDVRLTIVEHFTTLDTIVDSFKVYIQDVGNGGTQLASVKIVKVGRTNNLTVIPIVKRGRGLTPSEINAILNPTTTENA